MMQGAMSEDMHSGSYLDVPFCSRDAGNLNSKQGKKISTGKAYSRFNINASSLKNLFADDKMSYNIAEEDNYIWKGRYVFHHLYTSIFLVEILIIGLVVYVAKIYFK